MPSGGRRAIAIALYIVVGAMALVLLREQFFPDWPRFGDNGTSGQEVEFRARLPSLDIRSIPAVQLSDHASAAAGGLGAGRDFDMTGASSAVELDDGRVMVLAPWVSRVLVFDTAGRGQRLIGGLGEGPGQFRRPSGLVHANGDTVLLVDPANHRKSWITANDGVVRSAGLAPDFPGAANHTAGMLPDGSVVVTTRGAVRDVPTDSTARPGAVVYLVDSTGGTREIMTVPDIETAMTTVVVRGTPIPTPHAVRFGLHANIVVWDTLIAVASTARYQVELWNRIGERVGQFGFDRPRRPVTTAMKDSVVVRELEKLSLIAEPIADRGALEREARGLPVSDSFPPIDRLLVSTDGILWAIDPIAPGDRGWSAIGFRGDGSPVARLVSDRPGVPLVFGADHVVVKVENDDGVVSLLRYSFSPPPASNRLTRSSQ